LHLNDFQNLRKQTKEQRRIAQNADTNMKELCGAYKGVFPRVCVYMGLLDRLAQLIDAKPNCYLSCDFDLKMLSVI